MTLIEATLLLKVFPTTFYFFLLTDFSSEQDAIPKIRVNRAS